MFSGKNLGKRFKKVKSKKPLKATKQIIQLAGDLLGTTSFLGFSSLGKKKNALLRGAVLGTAAGLGSVFLNDKKKKKEKDKTNGHEGYPQTRTLQENFLTKALQVSLFTIGGLIAGRVLQSAVKKTNKNRKKKNK